MYNWSDYNVLRRNTLVIVSYTKVVSFVVSFTYVLYLYHHGYITVQSDILF